MASSPTSRTLKLLRDQGWQAQVVERWIPQARKRIDLFGIIDIVAIRPGIILGVQTTSASNHAAHLTKALTTAGLKSWLRAGGRFAIWSWRRAGKQGKRKLWAVRKQELTLEVIRGLVQKSDSDSRG